MQKNFTRSSSGLLRIQRLLQHALVELQPAQFPIDEMSRAERYRFCFGFHETQERSRQLPLWEAAKPSE